MFMRFLKKWVPGVFAFAVLAATEAMAISTNSDPYKAWATAQWGAAVVGDPLQEATVWGENANPDRDAYTNLQEYAMGTDPRSANSDPVTWDFGKSLSPGYLALKYSQRADDAALVVVPQYSSDMKDWWPLPPRDAFTWMGDSTYFWNTTSSAVINGMQNVTQVCTSPLASSAALFSRVLVMRNKSLAIGTPFDALRFSDRVSAAAGSVADSNSVVLTGFAGSMLISASGGAHLIVNGMDVGTSANVAAGSVVSLRAASPAGAGTVSYSLNIGTFSSAWSVITRTPSTQSVAVAPGISSTPSGYTPVSASVGEGGAASIYLPITLSPGTGGMEPKLAISYSSQGGNGLLGVGFGLSGLSAITRTGPTQYLDGIKGGVSFGPNDRFTMDGQRLVLYSGTSGGDSAEYRTEMESFSKVTSLGSTNAGPLSWTMRSKAGLIYEFGSTSNSRILANRSSVPGDSAVLIWALTRITDNVGNSIEFTYATPDSTESGNPRIAAIAYTKNTNAGLSAGQQIVFSYENRPDVRTSYVAGSKVVLSKRLSAVECQQGGNIARRYEFAYQQAEISGNSQLTSVTEKGKKPASSADTWQTFPATTFTWDKKPANTLQVQATTPSTDPVLSKMGFSKDPPSILVQGDFSGDGRMDIMFFDFYGGTNYWVASGRSDGKFDFASATGFTAEDGIDFSHSTTYSRVITGDFDGDGRTDVLQMNRTGSRNWVAFSKGEAKFDVRRGSLLGALQGVGQTGDYRTDVLALDLNGDGRTDIVLLDRTGNNRVFLSKGDGSFSEVPMPANDPFKSFVIAYDNDGTNTYVVPGDYNGDGLGDILLLSADPNLQVQQMAVSNGNGTFTVKTGAQLGGIANVSFRRTRAAFVSGDFNGDGLTDLAHFDNDTYPAWVALCKGDGTFDVITNPPTLQGLPLEMDARSRLLTGDFGGNGFSDIFHAYFNNGSPSVNGWLVSSKGDSTFLVQRAGSLGALDGRIYDAFNDSRMRSRHFIGDFDGDGTDDIVHLYQEADVSYHTTAKGYNAERVVQVTNGHGGYTKIIYEPLTNPWVYTKGIDAVYPYCDVQGAMYVVGQLISRNGADGDALNVQSIPTTGESTMFYHYWGARACLDGRGYQGFFSHARNESRNGDQFADGICHLGPKSRRQTNPPTASTCRWAFH